MVRDTKPVKKTKWNNVGLPPEVDAELERVCEHRGWNKKEAVKRMINKELSEIAAELQPVGTPDHAT